MRICMVILKENNGYQTAEKLLKSRCVWKPPETHAWVRAHAHGVKIDFKTMLVMRCFAFFSQFCFIAHFFTF